MRVKGELKHFFGISAGWLFADMLLALAMLFLAANTFTLPSSPMPPVIPPTATATPRPSLRILETNYCRLVFDDRDPNRFRSNLQFAIGVLEPGLAGIKSLHRRQVGIAIAYGGVDNINDGNDRGRGIDMASKVYDVMRDLGRKEQAPTVTFKGTSYYESIFTGLFPSSKIVIDLYLVVSAEHPGDTCNNTDHHLP